MLSPEQIICSSLVAVTSGVGLTVIVLVLEYVNGVAQLAEDLI